jgi:hypothetical protein
MQNHKNFIYLDFDCYFKLSRAHFFLFEPIANVKYLAIIAIVKNSKLNYLFKHFTIAVVKSNFDLY